MSKHHSVAHHLAEAKHAKTKKEKRKHLLLAQKAKRYKKGTIRIKR